MLGDSSTRASTPPSTSRTILYPPPAFVVYTHAPLLQPYDYEPHPTRPSSMAVRKRINQADTSLRHGVRVAKADACYGQSRALKSSKVYAHVDIRDPQGMANACMVNGFTRGAETHVNRRELPGMEWLCARRQAKDDYLQATALFDVLLQQPWLPYDPERRLRLQRAFRQGQGTRGVGDAWSLALPLD